jgi:hypothetical protein
MTDVPGLTQALVRRIRSGKVLPLCLALAAAVGMMLVDGVAERRIQDERARLAGIAGELAAGIDGHAFSPAQAEVEAQAEEGASTAPAPDPGATLRGLVEDAERLGLDGPVRVLRLRPDARARVTAAAHEPHPNGLEALDGDGADRVVAADYDPAMASAFFDQKSTAAYRGSSFTTETMVAYAPLADSFGATIAVLEAPVRSNLNVLHNALSGALGALALLCFAIAGLQALAKPRAQLSSLLAERREASAREQRTAPRKRDLETLLTDAGYRFRRSPVNQEEGDPSAVDRAVRAAFHAVEDLAARKQVRLRSSLADGTREIELAHHELVYTILEQLLDNGVRHSPRGGSVTLRILATPEAAELRFEVVDTGKGLSWQDQSRIRQQAGSVCEKAPVDFAGLDVVQAALGRMGRELGFESQPGHGSRFWFTAPCAGTQELRASA